MPVTSLCPCSKAISDYGAHNQRGLVTIQVRSIHDGDGSPRLIWIEELIEIAEQSASAPVYPLLKRADERHVTMQAYDNPVFVEDIVRNVAARLQADARVAWFRVHAVNQESIHNHSASPRSSGRGRVSSRAEPTGDVGARTPLPGCRANRRAASGAGRIRWIWRGHDDAGRREGVAR